MSTVRVYELAKELNVSNKEVLDFLKSKNIDLTSHMSNVEDEHVRMVRENFKKGNVSAQSTGKQGEGERPKKKFIQVFRPQNASHMPERKQKPRQQAKSGQDQRGDNKRRENLQGENRGNAGGMRQDNRNNRPNNGRANSQNGENRQNRSGNGGDNRQQGRFHNNNGEGRFNNRNNSGEGH